MATAKARAKSGSPVSLISSDIPGVIAMTKLPFTGGVAKYFGQFWLGEALYGSSRWRPLLTEYGAADAHRDEVDALLDLLKGMLAYNPKSRLTFDAILQHPFITQFYPAAATEEAMASMRAKACVTVPAVDRFCGLDAAWKTKADVHFCFAVGYGAKFAPPNLKFTPEEEVREHWTGFCRPPRRHTAVMAWQGKSGPRCEIIERKLATDKKTAWQHDAGCGTKDDPKLSCKKSVFASERFNTFSYVQPGVIVDGSCYVALTGKEERTTELGAGQKKDLMKLLVTY